MRRPAHLLAPLALACALALAGCAGAQSGLTPTAPPPPPPTATPSVAPPAPTAPPPTAAPSVAPPAPTAPPPTAAPAAQTPASGPVGVGEILFVRGGALVALDDRTGAERALATGVRTFAATADGRRLALVQGDGVDAEIWLIDRDGGGLRQVTSNARVESGLSWSPDGLSLAYTSAAAPAPASPEWQSWSEWCAGAEARVVAAAGGAEQALGVGCEPGFSPDGRRIAFTTAPTGEGAPLPFPGNANSISIVNRQGENGWSVARSDGAGAEEGYLVHGPAWAPDGGQVAYQRFLGYQTLVDINLTEGSSSYERAGEPLGMGAGWLLPPSYAPDGAYVAVVEHNFSDARGFSGYDVWKTTVLRLGAEQELALPSTTLTLKAARVDTLERAVAAAWSPDSSALAVLLPAGWQPGLSTMEPAFSDEGPADLWRWRPGAPPDAKLATGVDFASPLLWLPPPPAAQVSEAGIKLAVPSGWAPRSGPADYLIADGPGDQVIAARLVVGGPPGGPEGLFPELLAADVGLDDPVMLPDGSMLRGATGAGPMGGRRAGMLRISADGDTAALYLTAPEAWPEEQARAIALLMASGR